MSWKKSFDKSNLSMESLDSIRRVLELSPNADKYWVISDGNTAVKLFSCHFDNIELIGTDETLTERERYIIRSLRGVVVSLADETPKIIARGFADTPTCVVTNFSADNIGTYGVLQNVGRFVDVYGNVHMVDFSNSETHTSLLHEGVLLRVSMIDGEALVTTNRRIDTTNSHWGDSPNFQELYHKYGGPAFKSLFNTSTSNYTHLFLIVHPTLQIASRYSVGGGYMMYLGYAINNVSAESEPLKVVSETADSLFMFPTPFTEPKMYTLSKASLSLDSINSILTYGSSNLTDLQRSKLETCDPRLSPGEAVVIRFRDVETGVPKIIRVCSLGHVWRTAVNNNASNKYMSYLERTQLAFDKKRTSTPTFPPGTDLKLVFNGALNNVYTYEQLFPHFNVKLEKPLQDILRDVQDHMLTMYIFEFSDYVAPPPTDEALYKQQKMFDVCIAMTMATPFSYIRDVSGYYDRLRQEREDVTSFLTSNFLKFKGLNSRPNYRSDVKFQPGYIDGNQLSTFPSFSKKGELNPGGKALVRIFNTASNIETASRYNNKSNNLELARNNLRTLINNEHGGSLYSLLNTVLKYKQSLEKPEKTDDTAEDFPALPESKVPRGIPVGTKRLVPINPIDLL